MVLGCDWWCRVIRECNCRLLDALKRWFQGAHGLRVGVPCYWRMQLQIARRLITVGSRWSWVVSGCAVLLGNATADC